MDTELKQKICSLRSIGKTYFEINSILNTKIPKASLSYICKNVKLPKNYKNKIKLLNKKSLNLARQKAYKIRDDKKQKMFNQLYQENLNLKTILKNKKITKVLLACLYLAEGSKSRKASLVFGNSDPGIIKLFLSLFRSAYKIDENKFRCTLQCRADQNIKQLQNFWSRTTQIPLESFYKPQIDKRSLGKRTIKSEYKGVCRIDYFSADIFRELMMIGKIITE